MATSAPRSDVWKPRVSQSQLQGIPLPRTLAVDHPLAGAQPSVIEAPIAAPASSPLSPSPLSPAALTAGILKPTNAVELDPLSAMLLEETRAQAGAGGGGGGGSFFSASALTGSSYESNIAWEESRNAWSLWITTKAAIQREFGFADKVNVTKSFMTEVNDLADATTRSVALDKTKARLEELERSAASDREATVNLSPAEYTAHMHKLQDDLYMAWSKQERVKSLKLAIQSAKLLGHTAVPQIYPNMFCFMINVLETFGQLVFERIRVKSEEINAQMGSSKPLPEDFTVRDIAEEAKEMCKNWMYKTACIREMLPRIYIETCLLKCYRFIAAEEELPAIIARLSKMIRGIGDPLVAVYARTYLSLMASQVIHGEANRAAVVSGIQDFFFSFKDISSEHRLSLLEGMNITVPTYLNIMSPALGWLLGMAGKGSSKELFTSLFSQYREQCNNTMVLKHFVDSFEPAYYVPHIAKMVEFAKEASPSQTTLAEVFASLANSLIKLGPPEKDKLKFLNETWKVITKVDAIETYLSCATVFIELLVKHYGPKELGILLKDIVAHVRKAVKDAATGPSAAAASGDTGSIPGQLPPNCLPHIEKVMTSLVQGNSDELNSVLTSDEFLILLDLFRGERKLSFCKNMLKTYVENVKVSSDAMLINTLFDVGKTLHDSIDSLSSDDERRQVSDLICKFIQTIDFGRDVESHLNSLVDCRRSFPNLDAVKDTLVLSTVKLSVRTLALVRGKHNKKTLAFVKGCFAYCHITIPSIDDPFTRMSLFKLAGEAALLSGCVPQADTFFKAVIQEVAELAESEDALGAKSGGESRVCNVLRSLLTPALVTPGHPTNGPFYLVKGIMFAAGKFPWAPASTARASLYISLIPLLCGYAQPTLPFHVPNLESNDVLYSGAEEYYAELDTVLDEVMTASLAQLKELSGAVDAGKEAALNLQLAQEIIRGVEITPAIVPITVDLLLKAKKLDPSSKTLSSLVSSVLKRAASGNYPSLTLLATALTA